MSVTLFNKVLFVIKLVKMTYNEQYFYGVY